MSIAWSFLAEEIYKRYGIRIPPKGELNLQKKKLIIYSGNTRVKIENPDPPVIAAAKAVLDEKIFEEQNTLTNLLVILYALRSAYEGIRTPFPQFKEAYKKASKDEIVKEIKECEKKYILPRSLEQNLTHEKLGEEIWRSAIIGAREKLKHIPTEISYKGSSLLDLCYRIAELSDKEEISSEELFM